MFSGIIEHRSKVLELVERDQAVQIFLDRPPHFDDIKLGDSIACNGVCLTVESFDDDQMAFTIGHETLKITGWNSQSLAAMVFNMERSLRFGDRVHGHIVSGHVDRVVTLTERRELGACLFLAFATPPQHRREIWQKSSVTLNGVSLTVNEITDNQFEVCLIPETLRQTNLADLQVGDSVNLETDYYMKALLNAHGDRYAPTV